MSVFRTTTNEILSAEKQQFDVDGSVVAPTQAISGGNVDPSKLKTLLRVKFGAGAYSVHVSSVALKNLPTEQRLIMLITGHAKFILHCSSKEIIVSQ
jgi:hypothetical protein